MRSTETDARYGAHPHRTDTEHHATLRGVHWLLRTVHSFRVTFWLLFIALAFVLSVDLYNWAVRNVFVYALNYCWKHHLVDMSMAVMGDITKVAVAAAVVQSKLDIAALRGKVEGLQAELASKQGACPSENDCSKCPCNCAPPVDCGRTGWTSADDLLRITAKFTATIASGKAERLVLQNAVESARQALQDKEKELEDCEDECDDSDHGDTKAQSPRFERPENAYFAFADEPTPKEENPPKEEESPPKDESPPRNESTPNPDNCTRDEPLVMFVKEKKTCYTDNELRAAFNQTYKEFMHGVRSKFGNETYAIYAGVLQKHADDYRDCRDRQPQQYLDLLKWVRAGLALVVLRDGLFSGPCADLVAGIIKDGAKGEGFNFGLAFLRSHAASMIEGASMWAGPVLDLSKDVVVSFMNNFVMVP